MPGPPEPPETAVDGSLILARFPSELLLHLAEEFGNPLALLVSRAHLSKAFRTAARAALAILTHIDLGTTDGSIPGICADTAGSRVLIAAGQVPMLAFDAETMARTAERVELESHYDCVVGPSDDFVFVSTSTGEILKIDMLHF